MNTFPYHVGVNALLKTMAENPDARILGIDITAGGGLLRMSFDGAHSLSAALLRDGTENPVSATLDNVKRHLSGGQLEHLWEAELLNWDVMTGSAVEPSPASPLEVLRTVVLNGQASRMVVHLAIMPGATAPEAHVEMTGHEVFFTGGNTERMRMVTP